MKANHDEFGVQQARDFLSTTGNFNKRFYTVQDNRSNIDDKIFWYITFNATAISRDLIYQFSWTIPCTRDPTLNKTYTEYLKGETPLYGLVPENPNIKDFLYIHHTENVWQDRFKYEGLTQADHIEETQ